MWQRIRRILMIVLAAVFLFCAGSVAVVQYQYRAGKRLYSDAAMSFTESVNGGIHNDNTVVSDNHSLSIPNDGIFRLPEKAPITVDFESLQKINSDVDGWIYCPETVIDYPVMHGPSNDTYLYHSYDGTGNISGSIFVDEVNRRYFADPITVIYGHHMGNGTMFATLDWWQDKQYLDKHPIMWLLTPWQDYKVVLYSGYDTSVYSDTYDIPPYYSDDVLAYLQQTESYSDFHIEIDLDPSSHYIVLSTCAYAFEDARTVLFGKLLPVMSAGGVPFE